MRMFQCSLVYKGCLFVALMASINSDYITADHFIEAPNGKKYALQMFDPVVFGPTDHTLIHQFFKENGYVVVDHVSEIQYRDELVTLIDQLVQENIPFSRRLGFLDLYHDDLLAQLRQDVRIYDIFSNIFGTEKLWVVFDRIIYQSPEEDDQALTPHVDQNPLRNPGFFNIQAMLALRDMNEFTGTLAVMPRSHLFFEEYAQWAKPSDGYIEHQGERVMSFIGLRLKEGQLVLWDSRTTHSRFRSEARSNRYAALLTFTIAQDNPELTNLRLKYFDEGIGWNNHEAGLRATSRPRCQQSLRRNSEQLTLLGRRLYGLDSWFFHQ